MGDPSASRHDDVSGKPEKASVLDGAGPGAELGRELGWPRDQSEGAVEDEGALVRP